MNYFLSTVALLIGPVIYAWGRKRRLAKQMLDGFVLVVVAGIVCIDIIPATLDAGGLLAAASLAAGLLFPVLIEKTFQHSVHKAHGFIVVLAALGLITHALIDGIALLPGTSAAPDLSGLRTSPGGLQSIFSNPLAIGVILHRLPVGMAIWWSVKPRFGLTATLLTFFMIIVATGAAYFFGAPIVNLAADRNLALFQAFVAGSIVHVVVFGVSHHHDDQSDVFVPADNWGFRVGLLLGMFIVFAAPHIH